MSNIEDDLKRSKTDTIQVQVYIATKVVKGQLMTWNTFQSIKQGGMLFEIDREGYMVEYEDGYKSWSPKSTFERSHRLITQEEKNLING